MARRDDGISDRQDNDPYERNEKAYSTEHSLAWVTALASVVFVVLGLLAGFGVIGADEDRDRGTGTAEAGGSQSINWEDGALWLLPAIALGLVSRALHSNEHHTRRASATDRDDANESMFNSEHTLAYVAALATGAGSALTLLVGFDVFDNGNSSEDGMMWGLASIVFGVLTGTLHAVRHHQLEIDEDLLARAIEDRQRRGATGEARQARDVR